ncbi:hypothetical protein [Spiroplasma endosymbiont of Panorpa germanica]|uniref:hypothetical protein n=1 Tax=Spiroplasma endosymbiont of Panorpa germanica TaxID=3066314 RepID=UPI0030CC1574
MNKKTALAISIIILISGTGALIYNFQNKSRESYNVVSNDNKIKIYLNFKLLYNYKLNNKIYLPDRVLVNDPNTTILEELTDQKISLDLFKSINTLTLNKLVNESQTIELIPKSALITKINHLDCQIEDFTGNGISQELASKTMKIMSDRTLKMNEILNRVKKIYKTAEEKKFFEKFIKEVYI